MKKRTVKKLDYILHTAFNANNGGYYFGKKEEFSSIEWLDMYGYLHIEEREKYDDLPCATTSRITKEGREMVKSGGFLSEHKEERRKDWNFYFSALAIIISIVALFVSIVK